MRLAPAAALLLALAGCAPEADPSPDAASMPAASMPYDEPHRPQVHFSPPEAWMNDPNGMVVLDGEYHLFYQYHPDSTVWGPMHWGHAVSRDLVHWEHLPIALYPDSLGAIFSGSAVVDVRNTAGFQTGDVPALVAVFTQHDAAGDESGRDDFQTQGLAFSTDRGRTWAVYDGNPVLPNPGIRDFRDPKVFWHEASGKWVMSLAVADRIRFYGSPDLKAWTELSEFGAEAGAHGGVWECPDLFPLTTASGETRWVLLVSINPGAPNGGSGTQYFVGDFDGTTFTAETPADTSLWLDGGRDNYAGVTWAGVPEADGRRLFLGWMSNWDYAQVVPTERWRSAMTLPRTLHLLDTPGGFRVASRLVAEVETLRGAPTETAPGPTPRALAGVPEAPFEAVVTLRLGDAEAAGVELTNGAGEVYRVGVDRARGVLFSDRRNAGPTAFSDAFARGPATTPFTPEGDTVTLRLVVDGSSVETFADDGRAVMTEVVFPSAPFDAASGFAEGAAAGAGATVYPLASIWAER